MAPPTAAGARFRQRKISVKQSLNVYKQHEIPDLDIEQQRNVHEFESGVDKSEETEEHLQKVIAASEAAVNGKKVDQVYIPTPDASQHWGQASKYYTGKFVEPTSYIKFSATVEDTAGCQYNMDEEDEEFLTQLNKESKKQLSESEFEVICERFETIIDQKQPFLTMDPESIFSYEEIKSYALNKNETATSDVSHMLEQELNVHPFVTLFDQKDIKPPRKLSQLLDLYGEKIYAHWRGRRLSRLGKPVFPVLKFEDPSDKNDNDPYVCFRRREFRQARKTRRTDTQGSERLRALHRELKTTRQLVLMCTQREWKRLEALKVEKNIFKLRCDVKTVKRDLNIPGEEEDLIAHKKKKVVPPPAPEVKKEEPVKEKTGKTGRPKLHEINPNQDAGVKAEEAKKAVNPVVAQPYVKLPASKIPDIDLVTVQAVLNEKESAIARAVYEKLRTRKEVDRGWVNLTDEANNPLFEIAQPKARFTDKSHIPFSSIATSLYDIKSSHYIDHHMQDLIKQKKVLPGTKSFRAVDGEHVEPSPPEFYQLVDNPPSTLSAPIMELRKRIGRGNITYIDRKFKRSYDDLDEFFDFGDDDADVDDNSSAITDQDGDVMIKDLGEVVEPQHKKQKIMNVYDSNEDAFERLKCRWLFDDDNSNDFAVDPSRLNNISAQTQSIRFGSMILTKSLQNLQAQHKHHLQQLQQQQAQQAQLQQLQQQQAQQQQLQQHKNDNGANSNGGVNGKSSNKKSDSSNKPAGSGNTTTSSVASTPAKKHKSSKQKNGHASNSTSATSTPSAAAGTNTNSSGTKKQHSQSQSHAQQAQQPQEQKTKLNGGSTVARTGISTG